MNKNIILIISMTSLSACFPGEGFFEQAQISAEATQDVGVQMVGETSVAQVFAGANVTQSIEVPEGSPLEGTSLSIPPGALNVSMNITIQEAVTPATDASLGSLGIVSADTSSVATVFSNDAGVTAFSDGAAGTIQVTTSSGTTSLALTGSTDYRVMFSRHDKADGSCVDTVYQLSSSDFLTLASGVEVAQFKTPYFGTYQVISIPSLDFEGVSKVTEWGTTVLAEVVPEECKVVTKVEKEVLDTKNPIFLGAVQAVLNGQELTVSAPNISESPKFCNLNVVDGESPEGKTKKSESNSVSVNLESKGFPLHATANFQCTFTDGRFLEAPVTGMPAGIRLDIDTSIRRVVLVSDMNAAGSCSFDAYAAADSTDTAVETVSDPSYHLLDFSNDTHAMNHFIRMQCTYADGHTKTTPYVRFTLGGCTTCAQDETAPNVTNIVWPSTVASPGTATVTITASDDMSGLKELCYGMSISGSMSSVPGGCANLVNVSGSQYQANIQVPDYFSPNNFMIDWIRVSDQANNVKFLDNYNNGAYYEQGTETNNGTHNNMGISTVPIFSWSITAGVNNSPDTIPPTLTSLSGFPGSVSLPSQLNIGFGATDTGGSYTGSQWDYLPMCIKLEHSVTGAIREDCPHTTQVTSNTFNAELYLGTQLEDGEWFVRKITISDMAGNESYYNAPATMPGDFMEIAINTPVFVVTGGSDNHPPLVTGGSAVNLDMYTYDVSGGSVPATLTVAAQEASTVTTMCMWFDEDMSQIYEKPMGCQSATDNSDGTYSATFMLPNYMRSNPTIYAVSRIELHDSSGNIADLYRMTGADNMYTSQGSNTAVMIPTFEFINSVQDVTMPTINSISFNNGTYTVPVNAQLNINITDGESGIENGTDACVWMETTSSLRIIDFCGPVMSQGGDNYTMDVYLDEWLENDTYYLTTFNIYDGAGNQGSMYASSPFVTNATYDNGVSVVKTMVSGATLDNTPPMLTANQPIFNQPSYNLGENGYMTIEINEAVSGVALMQNYPCWRLTDTAYVDYVYLCGALQHVSGNQWKMPFQVPNNITPDTYYLEQIDVFDKAGNYTTYYSSSSGSPYSPDPGWLPPTINISP